MRLLTTRKGPEVQHTTNYVHTFITVAPDSAVGKGTTPSDSARPSVALLAFRLIQENPYRFTSDDVLFTVYATRMEVPRSKLANERAAFFAKPKACLRASDLGKKYGWGIHSDGDGKVALYGVETAEYARLASGKNFDGGSLTVKPAMRSKRAAT